MKAQDLKKSILQLAIQGKLVEQDPNDEPATVLLERIKAEKAAFVKAGKLKKDKITSFIYKADDGTFYENINGVDKDISDEIPFDIPDSWMWVRLNDLAIKNIKRGKSPVYDQNGKTLVFAQKCNTKAGKIDLSLCLHLDDAKLDKYSNEEFMNDCDIVINSTGTGTLGRVGMYKIEDNPAHMPLVPDSHVTVIRCSKNVYTYFLFYLLKHYQPYMERSGSGSTNQIELSAELLKELLVPLPPLAEQKRIVAKIEELEPLIAEYDTAETALTALNTVFPEQMKKSILQQAIQGKLVEQDPNDESATVLLERIKAEKAALVKAGKIKKDKPLPPITDDEIPFDIPDSWTWVRLGDIAIVNGGFAFKSSQYKSKGVRVVRISDFDEDGFKNNKIVRYEYNNTLEQYLIEANNIIMAMTGGTVGKSYFVVETKEPMVSNQRVATIKINSNSYPKYVNYVILAPIIQKLIQISKNSTNDNISMDLINNFILPLPPLAEQKRIVAKIEELMLLNFI